MYHKIIFQELIQWDSITQYYTVLHSITQHYTVLHSIRQYYTVLHSITQYYTVLHSITQYYTVLHSITQYPPADLSTSTFCTLSQQSFKIHRSPNWQQISCGYSSLSSRRGAQYVRCCPLVHKIPTYFCISFLCQPLSLFTILLSLTTFCTFNGFQHSSCT